MKTHFPNIVVPKLHYENAHKHNPPLFDRLNYGLKTPFSSSREKCNVITECMYVECFIGHTSLRQPFGLNEDYSGM